MELDDKLEQWLVPYSGNNNSLPPLENIFESLGLSTNLKDWLLLPSKEQEFYQRRQPPVDCSSDMQSQLNCISNENSILSNNRTSAQVIDEIISRGSKFWLCEPDMNKDLDTIGPDSHKSIKRKLENDVLELRNFKQRRV
eukprot:gene8493-14492_t